MPGSRRLLLARIIEWVALGALPILTALRATGAPGIPANTLQMLHRDLVEWYVVSVAVCSVLAIVGKIGQVAFGAENKLRIKAVLDALDEACFRTNPAGERYFNRVTLFKANRRRTWLKPFCRAGDRYQRGIQSFSIDNNDEQANEGIIGQAWFRNSTVIADLPECPQAWSTADPACLQFASSGLLPVAKAARLRVKSRSLLATPVRNLQGAQWGVLILDSRMPNAFDGGKEALVTSIASALGKVL